MKNNAYTVSEVSRLARVTVRTLHHYDEIGLLVPRERSAAGYRLYSHRDLQRLHEILVLRELGFSLAAIVELIDQPAINRVGALTAQRELLRERAERTKSIIRAIDATLASIKGDKEMSTESMFEGFEPETHAVEANERWGDTEAYKESVRRTKRYSKEDWALMHGETATNVAAFVRALDAGVAADSPGAMQLAEEHRQGICRWFYECSYQIHVGLAEMYVSDERFTTFYDRHRPGLAAYVAAAIKANAQRSGGPSATPGLS